MSMWDETWRETMRAVGSLNVDMIEPISVQAEAGRVTVIPRWEDLERTARSLLGDTPPTPVRDVHPAAYDAGWRESVTFTDDRQGITLTVTSSHPVTVRMEVQP